MTEIWKPIPGYEGCYEASNEGRVRSLDRRINRKGSPAWWKGKELKIHVNKTTGRPQVCLYKIGSKTRTVHVYVLVAEAFLGPRPEGMECCHYDDNPMNNRLDNLRWDTKSANKFDSVRNGIHPQSSKTHCTRGHEFTSENTRVDERSGFVRRHCRRCDALRQRAYQQRKAVAS